MSAGKEARLLGASKRYGRGLRGVLSLAALLGAGALILLGADKMAVYFREGLELAATRVLPSTFPFMVISSMICALTDPSAYPRLSGMLGRLFSLGGAASAPLIIGNLTGFPIGGKMAAELYMRGELSRSEAERLLAYADNPSPPFVIAGVGIGILGERRLGVILLVSLCIGTLLSAQLMRGKRTEMPNTGEIPRQKYDFVGSVKSAAASSVYMLSFVTLFYIIISAVRDTVDFAPLRALLILVLEVTGAVSYIGSETALPTVAVMGLSGFALGFGGLSVMAQVSAVTSGSGLSLKRYVFLKVAEGLFTALIAMGMTLISNA